MSTTQRSRRPHPRSRFDSYLENSLTPGSRRRVQRHVAECHECAEEISQRAAALRYSRQAQQSHTIPVRQPAAAAPAAEAVLRPGGGIAGWKVVIGLVLACTVAVAMLLFAWVAGGRGSGSLSVGSPSLLPQELSDTGSDARLEDRPLITPTLTAGSPSSTTSSGASGSSDASASSSASSDEAQWPLVSTAGSTQGADLTASGTEVPVTALSQLRGYGWNIPGLADFGMSMQSASVLSGENWAEISTQMRRGSGDDEIVTVVRECRQVDDDQVTGCPVEEEHSGPVTTIDIGPDTSIEVQTFADDTWTARLNSEHASYQVDSSSPVENAAAMMSALRMSEQSRIKGGALPDSAMDRLMRGFQEIIPGLGQ